MDEQTPSLSAEKSFTGDNRYHFHCDTVGHRPTYFVCLHKMKRFKEKGDLPECYAQCETAMRGGSCMAVHMREEEILSGKAIYFEAQKEWIKPAGKVKGHATASLLTPQTYIRKPSTPTASTPVTPPKPKAASSSSLDFATVVNELVKDQEKVVKEVPVEPPVAAQEPLKKISEPVSPPEPETPPKAQESLLEMARRLKRQKAAEKA